LIFMITTNRPAIDIYLSCFVAIA